MNLFPLSLPASSRLGLGLAVLVLAGCSTPGQQVGVTSPPPPPIGSVPIAAYDDYARIMAPPLEVRIESFAQSVRP